MAAKLELIAIPIFIVGTAMMSFSEIIRNADSVAAGGEPRYWLIAIWAVAMIFFIVMYIRYIIEYRVYRRYIHETEARATEQV